VDSNECELSCDELGIKVILAFDPVLYDEQEIEDISEMFAGVLEAWHRRRNMVFTNPKAFGIEVH